jgi:hypothetical protein
MFDIGAVDAEIVQLSIRIGREFLDHLPIDATLAEVTPDEGKVHRSLHLIGDGEWGPDDLSVGREALERSFSVASQT